MKIEVFFILFEDVSAPWGDLKGVVEVSNVPSVGDQLKAINKSEALGLVQPVRIKHVRRAFGTGDVEWRVELDDAFAEDRASARRVAEDLVSRLGFVCWVFSDDPIDLRDAY